MVLLVEVLQLELNLNDTLNEISTKFPGFYLSEGGTLIASETKFENNSAPYGGGLYTEYRSFVFLTLCEFNLNSANESGGGIYCR